MRAMLGATDQRLEAWFLNQTVGAALLKGGLMIAGGMLLLSLVVNAVFLAIRNRADNLHDRAGELVTAVQEILSADQEFLLRDRTNPEFHEKGVSPTLTRRAEMASAVAAEMLALAPRSGGASRKQIEQAQQLFETYNGTFDRLVASVRELGFKNWGVEGNWSRAVGAIEVALSAQQENETLLALLRLRRDEKDYLLRGEPQYANAVREGVAQLELRSGGVIGGNLREYRGQFERYLVIQQRIGDGASGKGLLGELGRQAQALEEALHSVRAEARADSGLARTALNLAMLLVAAMALGIGGWFVRRFSGAIARPLGRLSDATARVGGGALDTRLEVTGKGELAELATSFNGMTHALATLVGRVQVSSIKLAASLNDIAATTREQQATAGEVAATTLQIGATSKEIAATSKESARAMEDVASVANDTAKRVGKSQEHLERMQQTMRTIVEAAAETQARLSQLSDKATNITQVTTTITKVADQTNLLSLNAAIEAEKAGEYGRGFSVVATEIRRLADQTAVATFDIGQMVREVQSAVSAGLMGMDKFSEGVRRGMLDVREIGAELSQVIQHVQALPPRFEAVNESMQTQSTGAEQISESLVQLKEAAQQAVTSLQQSSEAIVGLEEVANSMRGSVSRFKLGERARPSVAGEAEGSDLAPLAST